MEIRDYSRAGDKVPVGDLVEIQRMSYRDFLQEDVDPDKREDKGLEAVLRESFPIESYDGAMKLHYVRYHLDRPRYEPEHCRKLKLTYCMPLRIVCRLEKPEQEQQEEDIYIGELPIMMGGGEFLINGAERVIVTQLHRSPGVDFSVSTHSSGKRLHGCRIIPERGSWLELSVSKKDILHVRVDQSGKFSVTTLLRAFSEKYCTDEAILKLFHDTEHISLRTKKGVEKALNRIVATNVVDKETGEVIVEAGRRLTTVMSETLVK